MGACELFTDDRAGGCVWCDARKGEHVRGECRRCGGWQVVVVLDTGEEVTPANPLAEVGVRRQCPACSGAGAVDRRGRPSQVGYADGTRRPMVGRQRGDNLPEWWAEGVDDD